MRTKGPNLWLGTIAGAMGGLAGSVAMNGVSRIWSVVARGRLSGREERLSNQGGRPDVEAAKKDQRDAGEPSAIATTATAERVAEPVLERRFSPDERVRAGEVVHYAYGALAGAFYGGIAEYFPRIRSQRGAMFGLLLWIASVEVALPLLRLSEDPDEYTPGEHSFSAVSHIAYGITTEAMRGALRART